MSILRLSRAHYSLVDSIPSQAAQLSGLVLVFSPTPSFYCSDAKSIVFFLVFVTEWALEPCTDQGLTGACLSRGLKQHVKLVITELAIAKAEAFRLLVFVLLLLLLLLLLRLWLLPLLLGRLPVRRNGGSGW